ncbi:MAG: 50S ribosomal protein L6 [Phycisphaerae bacterium]|nr:50S ribosomal protein L6 [Phycisphaerae bacterium]MDW8263034.1 50S ribosomal protein L6 [Phycisphaerales bacterium]
MSRIGKKPVPIGKAKVTISGQNVSVQGPKGTLQLAVHPTIRVELKGTELWVSRPDDERQSKALHGLTRALLANMVEGVTNGYRKTLELRGVGYRAEMKGTKLALSVGFANQIQVPVPQGLSVKVEPGQGEVTGRIVIEGPDKQAVGNFAAEVRKIRKPEPYKGKGIRYEGEQVKIKPGKAFAGAGAK